MNFSWLFGMAWFNSNTLEGIRNWETNHLFDRGYRKGKLGNTVKFYWIILKYSKMFVIFAISQIIEFFLPIIIHLRLTQVRQNDAFSTS